MAVIAGLAPLLALARYPFAFGLIVTAGLMVLFVAVNVRRRRFDRVAWLICAYPCLPLLVLYLEWGLVVLRCTRKSSLGLLDGALGVSDIGAYLCLLTYVASVAVVVRGRRADGDQRDPDDLALRRAAKRVLLIMPLSWAALFVLAMWDPFGALGYFFH